MTNELSLRYGMNPHQKPARVYVETGDLPFQVLNGAPGYINMLDALNAWQLVRELRAATGQPAAASFKHVSPAGAAIAVPLSDTLKQVYFTGDKELSPLATAYARARGADRMSSFGDFVALSEPVDEATARLMRHEVSDGVIAPGYEAAALEMLREKKKGNYPILKIDPTYEPPEIETRQVFGITLEQKRNNAALTPDLFQEIVTQNQDLPDSAQKDLLVALIALKYLQSNSVCFTLDGQVIGAGAGQQSRIHCVRLAAEKAERWYLRQHPRVLGFQYREGCKRADRDNAIDQYFEHNLPEAAEILWRESFETVPERLTPAERQAWLRGLQGVALGSDAFFPFRDSIDRAHLSGVQYVAQPGGSIRDDAVIQACDGYGMVMVIGLPRLFHH